MADVLIAPTYDAMDSDYSIRVINDINYNLIHFSDGGFLINKYTSDVSLIFETGNSIVAQDSGGGGGGSSDSAGSGGGGSGSPTNVQRWIA